MRYIALLISFLSLNLSINGQIIPLKYSYSSTSPEFGKSNKYLSVYQGKDVAILQIHEADTKPDFNPSNHWDYNINGSLTNEQFAVVRKIQDQAFIVKEPQPSRYQDGTTFMRKEGNLELYKIKYSDLELNMSSWKESNPIQGLKTQQMTLSATLLVEINTKKKTAPKILTAKIKHDVWIATEVPYSPVVYNMLIHADGPQLFIEPKNYPITSERLDLIIGKKIYNELEKQLRNRGMLVKMEASYIYQNKDHSIYQEAEGHLILEEFNKVEQKNIALKAYPQIKESLFKKMHDCAQYARSPYKLESEVGEFNLIMSNGEQFKGSAYYHNTRQYFAIRGIAKNSAGELIQIVLLKISQDQPTKGKQSLSKAPVSAIRSIMKQGPPPGFMQKFFFSATLQTENSRLYLLYPTAGELAVQSNPDGILSGTAELNAKTIAVQGNKTKERNEKLRFSFKASQIRN